MSIEIKLKRKTVCDIAAHKGGEGIVMISTGTSSIARIIDAYCDMILVGDSIGMTIYGMENTLGVTLDMMINHGRAVVKSSNQSMIVIDMPFATYQKSPQQAYENCARMLAETGAAAVKLEGGIEMAETTEFLVSRGIPVMGHIGLMPQHFNAVGGYRYQGRNDAQKNKILSDALVLESAGAFAMLIEATSIDVADEITSRLKIPTIGIGASPNCDGQVLVIDDIIGLNDSTARFVKQYASIKKDIENAANAYAKEVKSRSFPEPKHCYGSKS